MFKVLIIDDESIIRKGLKNIINWKSYECEVCGEADNGVDGCRLIRELLPDIIITDIKMPEADGLTMLKEVRACVPDCKIIILTGYRDFDYIQESLKLGVFDYVLKPSKIEELTAIIVRAVRELKFQRQRTEEFDKLKNQFQQNIPVLREKLLYDVIYEINTDEEEITAKMKLFDMKFDSFTVLIVQNDNEETESKEISEYDRHLYQFGIINTLEEVFSDSFKIMSIPGNDAGITFIIVPGASGREMTAAIDKKCSYLQEIIMNCFGFSVTIAVSSEGKSPMELPAKFKECREALEHKFYLGSNSIIFHNDVDTFFKYDDHSMLEKLQKALLEGVRSGNESSVRIRLNDIFSYVRGMDQDRKDFIRNFYWNTISSINSIRISVISTEGDKKVENRQLNSLYGFMEKCTDLEEMNSVLEEAALGVTSKVNTYNNKSIKLVLRKAVEYLQAHYQEQVTLNEVADYSYVSTYYISRMFKRETGKNFVDYLNELRIEKAKELLKDVRYKTYEIAESVGIPDAHYFSRLFKKHVGVTPTEFRENNSL